MPSRDITPSGLHVWLGLGAQKAVATPMPSRPSSTHQASLRHTAVRQDRRAQTCGEAHVLVGHMTRVTAASAECWCRLVLDEADASSLNSWRRKGTIAASD